MLTALAFKMESNITVSFNFKLKLQENQQISLLKVLQETKNAVVRKSWTNNVSIFSSRLHSYSEEMPILLFILLDKIKSRQLH